MLLRGSSILVLCAVHLALWGQRLPAEDAQWEFDGDLESSTGQDALTALAASPAVVPEVTFETVTIGGQDAEVARFSKGTYFDVPHGLGPNGGGGYVNRYTLIMDVMFPDRGAGFTSLFQTNCCNENDGDWFINTTGGLGINGVYGGAVPDGVWHRLALVVDLNARTMTHYVNGVKVNETTSEATLDGRFALYSPADTDPEPFETFFIFADESGENAEGLVNSMQFHDIALAPGVIAEIGGPSAGGIPTDICIFPPAVATRDIGAFRTARETNADFLPGDVMDVEIVLGEIRAATPPCTAPGGVIVVEKLPAGWAPSQISDAGVHDAGANTITWSVLGPDLAAGQELTYKVTAAASSELTLVFDGTLVENIAGAKPSPIQGESILLTDNPYDVCGGIRCWNILGCFTQPANDWPDGVPGSGDNPGEAHMRLDFMTDSETFESDFIWFPGAQIATAFGGDGLTTAASSSLQSGSTGANPNGVPQVLAWNDRDSFINLDGDVFGADHSTVMAYLQCYVTNPGPDRDVQIGVDSDDSIQVILNDEEVWIHSVARGSGACEFSDKSPDGASFPDPIVLLAGENKLILKVFEGGGDFNVQFRFEDPDTFEPMTDLAISKFPEGLCLTPPVIATRNVAATETVRIEHAEYPRWRDGDTYDVSIALSDVRAGGQCAAPATVRIEETVPVGWTPSLPSGNGTITGTRIVWNLTGGQIAPGVLTYRVTAAGAPGRADFRGRVSETGSPVTSVVIGDVLLENPPAFTEACFIKSWLLLGPYAQPGFFGATPGVDEIRLDHLCDGAAINEIDVEPRAGDTVDTAYNDCARSTGLRAGATTPINPGGVPTWFSWQDADDTVIFSNYYGANLDQLMVYAVAYIDVAADVAVDIGISSDDSVQVLLDGEEIWVNNIARAMGIGVADVIPAATVPALNPLTAGVHKLMVKVFEGTVEHGFRLRFQDPSTGEGICEGISVCLDPAGCVPGEPGTRFLRGDSDGNGQVQLTDAIRVLNVLFLGLGAIDCLDAADADDSGGVQLTDAIRILNVLFLGLGVIPPPNECGLDPTDDGIDPGCASHSPCET